MSNIAKEMKPIKLGMSEAAVKELNSVCSWLVKEYEPENEHEELHYHYLCCLHWDLFRKLTKGNDKYTMSFTAYEALLFCQLWSSITVDHFPFGKVVILKMIEELDQAMKAKHLINGGT